MTVSASHTSRTGIATARTDYVNLDGTSSRKRALKSTYFSKDHFSSSLADNDDPMRKRTRVVIKLLEGRDLLVADLITGTSDPVCFVWVGAHNEGDIDLDKDERVQATDVCKHTVDPVWDTDFVFPLRVQSVEDIMIGRVNITIRDHDDEDGDTHYDDLGHISVPLEAVLTEGKPMVHTQLVQLPARWYPIQRCRGMRKVSGALKVAVGIFIGEDAGLVGVEGDETDKGVGNIFKGIFRKKIQGAGTCINGQGGRAASTSPIRRNLMSSRVLTARGGTTSQRPKSAPTVTTLTSPDRSTNKPFAFASFIRQPAKTPVVDSLDTQNSSKQIPDGRGLTTPQGEGSTTLAALDTSLDISISSTPPQNTPKSRGDAETSKEQRCLPFESLTIGKPRTSALMASHDEPKQRRSREEVDLQPSQWAVEVPNLGPTRPSSKLSKLATQAGKKQQEPRSNNKMYLSGENQVIGGLGGEVARSRLWQMDLLRSMQRLDERSTERMAYGELRALGRDASPQQVAQMVSEARKVRGSSPVSVRLITLRLLSRLCWERPQAMSKVVGNVISYIMERIHDEESASLRGDLAGCTGSIMLSALRNSTPDVVMVQLLRLVGLVKEQRASVRESAGVCVAASVLPLLPPVPVEIKTSVRGVDDVRLSIGQAFNQLGLETVVPRDVCIIPGGRAIAELPDASAAEEFHAAISAAAGYLPPTWEICPFPEESLAEVSEAASAHAARLTVISEELLAIVLEALDSSRTQGTRGSLFDSIANMALICISHEEKFAMDLSLTLVKGLPAIVHQLFTTLGARQRHTWRERLSSLQTIIALANLKQLQGSEGPLGKHRQMLVTVVTATGHDTVKTVREAAKQALHALDVPDVDSRQSKRTARGLVVSEGGEDADQGRPRPTSRNGRISIAALRKNYKAGRSRMNGDVHNKESRKKKSGLFSLDESDRSRDTTLSRSEDNVEGRGRKYEGFKRTDGRKGVEGKDWGEEGDGNRKVEENVEGEGGTGGEGDKGGYGQSKGQGEVDLSHKKHKKSIATLRESTSKGKDDLSFVGMVSRTGDESAPPMLDFKPREIPQTSDPRSQETLLPKGPEQFKPAIEMEAAIVPASTSGLQSAQVDMVRLLRQLGEKTDTIACTLSSLDQRLVGLEKTLQASTRPASSSPPEPVRKKSKRPRSDSQPIKTHAASGVGLGKGARKGARMGTSSSNIRGRRHDRLQWGLLQLLQHGEVEQAFQLVLGSGGERDILRLMGRVGPGAFHRAMGMETQARLFAFVSREISAGVYTEHVLPWVFELVRLGQAYLLPRDVRSELVGALHGLAAVPTDQGVMAARLGPHISLAAPATTNAVISTSAGRGSLQTSTHAPIL